MKRVAWLICAVSLLQTPAAGQEPKEAGFNELIVIDPAVQENGLPTVQIEAGKVEIPPTLHVHPYYYSGDKEYQAQILNGGPTIVVANHPKTGEKLYIDLVLPQGAPTIAYNAHSITYVYKDRRVLIEFGLLHRDRAIVKYVSGRGVIRESHEQLDEVAEKVQEHSHKSKIVTELGELREDVGNVAKGSVGVVTGAGAVIVERTRAFTRILPGVPALKSIGTQAEARSAVEEVRQAGKARLRDEEETIRTIR